MTQTAAAPAQSQEIRSALAEAKGIAGELPDLLIEARRVASTVIAGWHGRRTPGRGETFWQFRPFVTGEASARIDWRRSAQDDHLYVREKEWEVSHLVWLWVDLSPSMVFRSKLAPVTKRDRAVILLLALTELLAAAGERIGILGESDPTLSRNAAEVLSRHLARMGSGQPNTEQLRRFNDVVLIGDFLDPLPETEAMLDRIIGTGASAHLIQVFDPAEETFPYSGRTEFIDPEQGLRHVVGRAEQYQDDYRNRLAALRGRLSDICRRLDWSFQIHRTDSSAAEPLLGIHTLLADRHARQIPTATGHAA